MILRTPIKSFWAIFFPGLLASCSTMYTVTTGDDADQAQLIYHEALKVVARSPSANGATVYCGHDKGMFVMDIYGIEDLGSISQITASFPTDKMTTVKFNEKIIRIRFIDKERWAVNGNYKERIDGKVIQVTDVPLPGKGSER